MTRYYRLSALLFIVCAAVVVFTVSPVYASSKVSVATYDRARVLHDRDAFNVADVSLPERSEDESENDSDDVAAQEERESAIEHANRKSAERMQAAWSEQYKREHSADADAAPPAETETDFSEVNETSFRHSRPAGHQQRIQQARMNNASVNDGAPDSRVRGEESRASAAGDDAKSAGATAANAIEVDTEPPMSRDPQARTTPHQQTPHQRGPNVHRGEPTHRNQTINGTARDDPMYNASAALANHSNVLFAADTDSARVPRRHPTHPPIRKPFHSVEATERPTHADTNGANKLSGERRKHSRDGDDDDHTYNGGHKINRERHGSVDHHTLAQRHRRNYSHSYNHTQSYNATQLVAVSSGSSGAASLISSFLVLLFIILFVAACLPAVYFVLQRTSSYEAIPTEDDTSDDDVETSRDVYDDIVLTRLS